MNIAKNNLLLSICIATRGRKEILLTTLTSIYNSTINLEIFEVVIYDSSDDNDLSDALKNYDFPNLIYKKGNNDGFLNLIHALEMGNGPFLKLHNDYSVLLAGSLEKMIDKIKDTYSNKPVLFFLNGSSKKIGNAEYSVFDDFLYNVSFYSSWSTTFGIWKVDFEKLKSTLINPMFPHTSLLFAMAGQKPLYIVNNDLLFFNQNVGKKGGYDLFKTFAVDYLGMVESCCKSGGITVKTFKHLKKDMLKNFFTPWYFETVILKNEYTFLLTGIKQSMRVYYPSTAYYYMVLFAYFRYLYKTKEGLKKIVIRYRQLLKFNKR